MKENSSNTQVQIKGHLLKVNVRWPPSLHMYSNFLLIKSTKYVKNQQEYLSCEVYLIQHYVIMFVSDLRQVSGFLCVLQFPPPIKKTDRHDITDILLKVA